jgi:hypothetical protein
MKLLFCDVMAWLLAHQDPRVAGVRYLHYGAIEHGNDGLAAWKRSFEFAPSHSAVSAEGGLREAGGWERGDADLSRGRS